MIGVGGFLFGVVIGWIIGVFRGTQFMPFARNRIRPIAAGLLHIAFGTTASVGTGYLIAGFSGAVHVLAGLAVGYVLRRSMPDFLLAGIPTHRERND